MGDVQPIASPAATMGARVLGALSDEWTTPATIARELGLTVGVVRAALLRLFETGKAMKRPAIGGPEWKRR